MDIIRLLLYIIATWMPFLIRKWLYDFKVWQLLVPSLFLLLPFLCPSLLGYSFASTAAFATAFLLFLIALATFFWLSTNHLKFILFACAVNAGTIAIFWSIHWQKNPFNNRTTKKPVIIELKEPHPIYSDIEESAFILPDLKSYQARRKVLGGILVRKFGLRPISATRTECIYKGYDDTREKDFYWDKCQNIIIDK